MQRILAETRRAVKSLAEDLEQLLCTFLTGPLTPQTTYQFESALRDRLRESGRDIVGTVYNRLESDHADAMPKQVHFAEHDYSRKNGKTKNRGGVGTVFGTIELRRYSYEPLREARDDGQKSIAPLEQLLGVVAGNATPALAERVGRLAADHTQAELLELLQREHGVRWSVQVLRDVSAAVSEGVAEHIHQAQKEQVLSWLQTAAESKGRGKITLAVGRDGIMVPIRGETTYKEGAVGTVSVHDRRGRRLGTVYLGEMPEAYQTTLSEDLTKLLKEVLQEWNGAEPRLTYVTDAGYHPTEYYEQVLRNMADPRRPGRKLEWTWTVDFYHACEYLATLSQLLFDDARASHAWLRRMRHRLKHEANAVFRILHSAAKYHSERALSAAEEKAYQRAYQYLNTRKAHLEYSERRRLLLPIGSGVTEAACKTVFTQRFKESGMSWGIAGGQVILRLRLAKLSGVWASVYGQYLAARPLPTVPTKTLKSAPVGTKAA